MLLRIVGYPGRLPAEARAMILDAENEAYFSAASIWEIAIKSALRRKDFKADCRRVAEALIASGFVELPITAAHAARVAELPLIHRDPFDRMLVAQSAAEPMTLLTRDAALSRYGPMVRVM